jgi:hypothetical protein
MRAPIFIIGYPRSGTSFVGKLIGKFTGYPSHGESHTIPLLQHIIHQINLYNKRTDFTGAELVKELDLQALKAINIQFIRDFYLRTYGNERFIDKTPGPTTCNGWGVVKQVFPDACFVACVRSPVEVYESAVEKFSGREGDAGRVDPIEMAEGWVGAMQGIEKLGQSPFSTDLHVVSQLELRVDPASSVPKLFKFLGVPEDKVIQGIQMCINSREDVLTKSISSASYKVLSETDIAPVTAKRFREVCHPTCSRWGISL